MISKITVFYPKKYVQLLAKICKKNNILIAFDEMQAGFGRTGKNFGFEHYGVKPDLICCGKGMGGGIAVSGVIGKKKILDLPEIGNMSSTNSANPIDCSEGLAVLEEIKTKNLIKNTKKKGKILLAELKKIKDLYPYAIKEINGEGLIAAIIFKETKAKKINLILKQLVEKCMSEGLLLVYTGRESIKIGPPLTITIDALIEGIKVLEKNIKIIFGKKND